MVDRHRPLVADRVPVELLVIGERRRRTDDEVLDPVIVNAGDRDVRVADADVQVVANVTRLYGGWRVVGGDRHWADAVVAIEV